MIDNIKCIMESLEELENIERFTEDYDVQRERILADIENRLELNSEAASCKVNNDISDLINLSMEQAYLTGFYYGIKLLKKINQL